MTLNELYAFKGEAQTEIEILEAKLREANKQIMEIRNTPATKSEAVDNSE